MKIKRKKTKKIFLMNRIKKKNKKLKKDLNLKNKNIDICIGG